jgi:DNA polymerase V
MAVYYVLADINAAFVGFITMFEPALKNKPCGVLSSNQGNVIARNQQLKDLNIEMGAPTFSAQPLVDKAGGHLFGSNFTLFGDMSARFHHELSELIIDPEIYSVDESFGKLDTECMPDLKAYATHIQSTIKKNIGLDIGIGVGRSKSLAKLASWFCKEKQWKHITHGITVLDTIERENWVLKRVKANQIWGIGNKTTQKLEQQAILTGIDLRDSDLKLMQRKFGVTVERTILELRGVDAITLKSSDDVRQQICVSKSMGIVITQLSLLKESLASHVKDAAFKLRKQGSWCKVVTVFIGTNPFNSADAQYHKSLAIELPRATQSTTILTNYAIFVLEKLFIEGFNYRKTGVVLSNLDETQQRQKDLFSESDGEESPHIDDAIDKINFRFGKGSIRLATEGFNRSWRPKDNLAPPSYTTSLNDIPTVK